MGWHLTGEWAPVRRYLSNYFDLLLESSSQADVKIKLTYNAATYRFQDIRSQMAII